MRECLHCGKCFDDTASACPEHGASLAATVPGPRILEGKYRLDQRLGQGGMGSVYRARHLGLEREFALKLVRSLELSAAGRFRVEAQALGRLEHPNILTVTDYGIDPREGGIPYLVTERLEGEDLEQYCVRNGPLTVEEALEILESVGAAVDFAHERGVLHRDLKTSNVFLARGDGGRRAVKVLDFGLAKLMADSPLPLTAPPTTPASAPEATRRLPPAPDTPQAPLDSLVEVKGMAPVAPTLHVISDATTEPPTPPVELEDPYALPESLTRPGRVEGTPVYMPPEVIQGKGASRASDVYSFGVMAYRMLVGALPFRGPIGEVLRAQVQQAPPSPSESRPGLNSGLDDALLAPLAKDPASRPATTRVCLAALGAAWHHSQRALWRRRELPRRLGLSFLLAWLVAAAAIALAALPLLAGLESRLIDWRLASVPRVLPDGRILVVTVDETSLAADPTPLADRADEFALLARGFVDRGATAVAFDFLLPERWSHSEEFARLVIEHSDQLTLAALSTPSGEVVGAECVQGLIASTLGVPRTSGLFAFSNIDEDPDGVTRRGRLWYRDEGSGARLTWAAHVARHAHVRTSVEESDQIFWIDHRTDVRQIKTLSWQDTAAELSANPETFRDRLILIGGDIAGSGDDYHRTPAGSRPRAISGVILQALMINTILARFPIHDLPELVLWGLTSSFAAVTLGVALLDPRSPRVALAVTCLAALLPLAAWLLFWQANVLAPVLPLLLSVALAAIVGGSLRARLAPFPRRWKAK